MKQFYEETGIINVYKQVNNLFENNLPSTFQTGTNHIDHIAGILHIINAVISVEILPEEDIIYLDYKGILIKFSTRKLLKVRVSPHIEINVIGININY